MRNFSVLYEKAPVVTIQADKVEFDWGTVTAVFLVEGTVVGAAIGWQAIISNDTL